MDSPAPRVFVSYSRKDRLEFARDLQKRLEAEGLSLYRDLSHLDGGEDWWRQIEAAIRSIEHLVMVLTPKALESRYVADEWKLARQEGKPVWPVIGPGELDFSHLPHWMARAHRHDITIPESFDRLVLGLRGPPRERRKPFMADPLPAGFIERPEKFAEIKRKLLDGRGEPVAITAALRGAGGFGKTALANALCHDPEIQDAFGDGILRVTLGEKPEDLVSHMADLIEILTGARPGVTHLDAAKTRLAEALDDRRCLLVIDDAWRQQDLAPFLHRGPKDRTTRLITTRDDRVLPAMAVRVPVDAMTSAQALAMLARDLGDDVLSGLQARFAALAFRLGEWPLLLGLANGVLRTRISRGASLKDALSYAEVALRERGLGRAFARHSDAARRNTASGTLEVSLDQLREAERTRFAELAVFVEDAEIPTGAALGLWRQTSELSELDGEDLLERLADLSLLIDLDLGRGSFRLHDVFRSLLREEFIRDRLADLDGKLMAHFRSSCPEGDLASLTDRYGLHHAMDHLRAAGEGEAADRLLLDPAWMQAKLAVLGVQPLLADYVGQPRQSAGFATGAVLAMQANVVAKRPRELLAQLLGRLSSEDAPGVGVCLKETRSRLSPPALVPFRPSFKPPGAEVRRFEAHEFWVTSLALLPDGRRALSGSADRTLRLWDLDTGAELLRLAGHESVVTSVALLPDGRRALSGSGDNTLRLWDLETGEELHHFRGHQQSVHSVATLPDGLHALSASGDSRLCLWDLETGEELRRFEGHKSAVTSVVTLPDGQRALSGSHDKTLRLWDLDTGAELRCFEGHESAVTSLALLPDGRRAVGFP
jgi:WD40 repeat protein